MFYQKKSQGKIKDPRVNQLFEMLNKNFDMLNIKEKDINELDDDDEKNIDSNSDENVDSDSDENIEEIEINENLD